MRRGDVRNRPKRERCSKLEDANLQQRSPCHPTVWVVLQQTAWECNVVCCDWDVRARWWGWGCECCVHVRCVSCELLWTVSCEFWAVSCGLCALYVSICICVLQQTAWECNVVCCDWDVRARWWGWGCECCVHVRCVSCELWAVNCVLRVLGCERWAVSREVWAVSRQLSGVSCQVWVVGATKGELSHLTVAKTQSCVTPHEFSGKLSGHMHSAACLFNVLPDQHQHHPVKNDAPYKPKKRER